MREKITGKRERKGGSQGENYLQEFCCYFSSCCSRKRKGNEGEKKEKKEKESGGRRDYLQEFC